MDMKTEDLDEEVQIEIGKILEAMGDIEFTLPADQVVALGQLYAVGSHMRYFEWPEQYRVGKYFHELMLKQLEAAGIVLAEGMAMDWIIEQITAKNLPDVHLKVDRNGLLLSMNVLFKMKRDVIDVKQGVLMCAFKTVAHLCWGYGELAREQAIQTVENRRGGGVPLEHLVGATQKPGSA